MLLRKMLRDMKLYKVQFISIFLMSLLGVFVFAGINGEWYGMQKEIDKYYADTMLPEYWVVGDNFSGQDVSAAEKIPGVAAVQRRLTFDGTAVLGSSPVIRINMLDENNLSKPYTVDGKPFDLSLDGIWLDSAFAKANDLKVGNSLTVSANGSQIKKTILGLVMSPEYVYDAKDDSSFTPDAKTFGFVFVPRSAIPGAAALPYNELLVSADKNADTASVKTSLEKTFSGKYNIILTRDTQLSTAMFKNEIAQNKAIGGIFPVVFFLIAALTMLTTMTRLTSGQRLQIGTLKALGFKRRKILMHYVSYGLWLGLAGGVIGLFTGPLIIPTILFSMQKMVYNLPEWKAAISVSDIAAVAVSTLCCILSSYFACKRELNDVPAATLRPRVPKAGRTSGLEKSSIWLRLGFSAQWNLRDVLRNKIRSTMAVVGVIGCITLLLWGLGLQDSIRYATGWLYGNLYTYETKINLDDKIAPQALEALQNQYPGQLIQESGIEMKAGETVKSGELTVVGAGNFINFETADRSAVSLPEDGLAISYKMAELLKVKTGDRISFHIIGENTWYEMKIGAVYRMPVGQGIAIKQNVFETDGRLMKPTALLSGQNAASAAHLPGVKSVQGRSELMQSFDSALDSMQSIIGILILAAVILGSVVLYNLGALSFTERTRELATLKVLGFSRKKIRSLLQEQNVWLTVLGILIGVPVSYISIGYMLSTLSDSSDFLTYIAPVSLIIGITGTFILSLTVNLLMARRVKTIDMVGALKSVE